MRTALSIPFILFFMSSAQAQDQAASPARNFELSAALDAVAPMSFDASDENRLGVRSAEVMVFAPIDHTFEGVINMAGHAEGGEFAFELHEGFLRSSKLIPQSNFKVGKFLLNIGRLNAFHQHDWPFITAPKSHREFLAPGSDLVEAESAMDTGIEYTWLLPTARFFDVTLGVTNGYCFGHCHGVNEERPPMPVMYIRPTTFFGGATSGGLLGLSYLVRKDASKVRTDLYGIDFTFKRREGKVLRWLVQTEWMYQTQVGRALMQEEKLGGYVFPQYGLNENWHFGLRFDAFSHLNLKFQSNGERRDDLDYAFVPTVTYRNSEFSTLRLAYAHEVDTTEGVGDVKDRQIQLQFVFLLGSHPSHDF